MWAVKFVSLCEWDGNEGRDACDVTGADIVSGVRLALRPLY